MQHALAPRPAAATAVYAFSADPITYGHINVVERVSRTFERVIVGVGRNPTKRYLFTPEQRLYLARQALSHLDNVSVIPFHGMVVDFACEHGAAVIVKGVRNAADFNYEQVHHLVGLSQRAGIDTHILFADPALAHVSSSAVKAIQTEHGFIHDYVPPVVKAALEDALSGQRIIGVTGSVGCGKSTVCAQVVASGARSRVEVHDIDLDKLGHAILAGTDLPLHAEVRRALVARFGSEIEQDGGISRPRLAQRAFQDHASVTDLNRILAPAMVVGLRRALYGKRGLVLLNGALLAELGLLSLCNNRVVLVDAPPLVQRARLTARGWSAKEIDSRVAAQWPTAQKRRAIDQAISTAGFGKRWNWRTASEPNEAAAAELLQSLLRETEPFGAKDET